MGAVRDDKDNLKVSLYYDNNGKRVAVATMSTKLASSPHGYSLTFSTADAHAAVGHKLGIEFANVRDNVISVDNVRLKTK